MANKVNVEGRTGSETSCKYCWQCEFETRMHMTKCIVCEAPLYNKPKPAINKKLAPATQSRLKQPDKRKVLVGFSLFVGAVTAAIMLTALWRRPRPRLSTAAGPVDVQVLGDTFLGYSTLWDPQFKQQLEDAQITIKYADELDQETRSQKLSAGEVDFMVTTINQLFETPSTGKIVALWDWTRGADRLVLNNKKFPKVTSIKSLNTVATQAAQQGKLLSIIFAGNTPSEYLSLLLADKSADFSLEKFNIIRVDDSSTAWQRFQNPQPGEQIVAGIFWEPHVTHATRQGYIASLSSAHVQRSIVDVVVASPQVLKTHPEKVQKFTKAYYGHIARNSVDKTLLRRQFEDLGALTSAEALNFMQGVYFFNADCANHWMNGSTQLLRQRLNYTAKVLYGSGRLSQLPSNFEQFYDGQFVAKLADSTAATNCPSFKSAAVPKSQTTAPPASRSQTISSQTTTIAVNFDVGAAQLNTEAKSALDRVIKVAKPTDTVKVEATFADASSARALSLLKSRTNAVEQYVADQLPTAQIRSTLRSGGTESPNIKVSIGNSQDR